MIVYLVVRLRSLSEVCKWKLRESIMSGASIQKAVKSLPIPKHLQTYLETRGHEKPRFQFTEEEPSGIKSEEQAEKPKEESEEAAVSSKDPSVDLV